jgi:hypothetical protein
MTRAARRTAVALGLALGVPGLLAVKTVRVPFEFATIRSAVAAAKPGDTIEVGDGIYLETNIVVDKNLRIRARRPCGIRGLLQPAKGGASSPARP